MSECPHKTRTPIKGEPNLSTCNDCRMVLRGRNRADQTQIGGDHYKKLKIQVVEYCMENGIPFMEGSAIKYLTRWRDKGGIEDLKKAKHFVEMLIEYEENKDDVG
jgi:hypothetical protein